MYVMCSPANPPAPKYTLPPENLLAHLPTRVLERAVGDPLVHQAAEALRAEVEAEDHQGHPGPHRRLPDYRQ